MAVAVLNKDTGRLKTFVFYLNMLWIGPIEIAIVFGLLIYRLGWSAAAGIALILAYLPLQYLLLWGLHRLRRQVIPLSDERIRALRLDADCMMITQVHGLEAKRLAVYHAIRVREEALWRRMLLLKALNHVLFIWLPVIAATLSVWLAGVQEAALFFRILAQFNSLMSPLRMLPVTINSLLSSLVSLERIERVMSVEGASLVDESAKLMMDESPLKPPRQHGPGELWKEAMQKARLVCVIGPAGSGKSRLLRAVEGGVNGEWIWRGASIRDNITLLREPFEPQRYAQALAQFDLNADLAGLPAGDQTLALQLSGGQRVRVALARLAYLQPEVALLDAPFASLDARTAARVEEAILQLPMRRIVTDPTPGLLAACDLCLNLGGFGRFTPLHEHRALTAAETLPQVHYSKQLEKQSSTPADTAFGRNFMALFGPHDMSLAVCLLLFAVGEAGRILRDLVIKKWLEAKPLGWAAWIGLSTLQGASYLAAAIWILLFTLRSLTSWHDRAIAAFLRAKPSLSRYYLPAAINALGHELGQLDLLMADRLITMAVVVSTVAGSMFLIALKLPGLLPAMLAMLALALHLYLQAKQAWRQSNRLFMDQAAPLAQLLGDLIEGSPTIKAVGVEAELRLQAAAAIDRLAQCHYVALLVRRWVSVRTAVCAQIILVGGCCAFLCWHHPLAATAMAGLLLSYAISAAARCDSLVKGSMELESNLFSVGRLTQVVASLLMKGGRSPEPQAAAAEESLQGALIRLAGVTARWPGEASPILSDLFLEIRPASRLLVVGRTGAGKSSLLSLLLGFLEVDCGRVQVGGCRLAYVPQDPVILPGSVRDNLPNVAANDLEMGRILTQVGLSPSLLDHHDPHRLCVSEQKALNLARALLLKPDLLLIDEPPPSLDQAIAGLDMALLIVTHRPEAFPDFTTLTVSHGRLVS